MTRHQPRKVIPTRIRMGNSSSLKVKIIILILNFPSRGQSPKGFGPLKKIMIGKGAPPEYRLQKFPIMGGQMLRIFPPLMLFFQFNSKKGGTQRVSSAENRRFTTEKRLFKRESFFLFKQFKWRFFPTPPFRGGVGWGNSHELSSVPARGMAMGRRG
jgi:hypothetical protein